MAAVCEPNITVRGSVHTSQQAQERCFSSTVGPYQSDDVAFIDGE